MTGPLKEARAYEEKRAKEITDQERAHVHLTPYCGWMNDPNGFSFYQDRYHLFYQYTPYQTTWGLMHWGHAVSSDLLHWAYLPCAMAPDQDYDKDGCFSGTALTMEDGRQKLFYTGVTRAEELQVQCMAWGDGRDYEKSTVNPVIDPSKLPNGYALQDFRDPKVWREDSGIYRMLVSARNAEGDGELLLFSSDDSETWIFTSVLFQGEKGAGVMLECPDLFRLDGMTVLLVSPMGGKSVAYLGELNEKTWRFHPRSMQQIDLGPDFYAPQTTEASDGRRILIGWMQNWDTVEEKTKGRKTAGQMTLPRELFLQDGRLLQRPVRELFSSAKKQEETRILAHDQKVRIRTETQEHASLVLLKGEAKSYTLLLDRYSCELFCDTTGEIRSENFAKEQEEITVLLPGIGKEETTLRMERFFI